MKKKPSSSSHQQLNNGFLAQEMPLSLGGWIFITASLILLSFIGSLVLSLILMQQGSLHINRLLFVVVNLVLTLWLWITMFGRKKRFIILAIAYFTAATLISFFSFIYKPGNVFNKIAARAENFCLLNQNITDQSVDFFKISYRLLVTDDCYIILVCFAL
ncbi:MAG TPA: hypothetical protein PKC68_01115 [Alphaproteobacteria bacterium]|nr:hypothetical protein [Alphaproteobacteria bacterium]